jgi:phosphomannomutase
MSKLNFKKNEISGPIDNGSNFFNVNQVALLTDAFCRYLKDKFPKNLEKSIVLGINRRENDSEMFAKIVAKTFAKHEIKVFYSEITVIDSMISYAIRNLNILGGINITTDNNLLHYNGMKFYDESGFPMSSKKMIEIKSYCQE